MRVEYKEKERKMHSADNNTLNEIYSHLIDCLNSQKEEAKKLNAIFTKKPQNSPVL